LQPDSHPRKMVAVRRMRIFFIWVIVLFDRY